VSDQINLFGNLLAVAETLSKRNLVNRSYYGIPISWRRISLELGGVAHTATANLGLVPPRHPALT
jgi:hypothetical protein